MGGKLKKIMALEAAGYPLDDGIGKLIKNVRDLSRLDWLKVICPKCEEEMTQ